MPEESIPIALGTWNFALPYLNGEMTLEDMAWVASEVLQVESLDLFDAHFHPDKDLLKLTEQEMLDHADKVRQTLEQYGVRIVGISAINDLSTVGESSASQERLKRWLRVAEVLDVQFVRVSTEKWWLVRETEADVLNGARLRVRLEQALEAAPSGWDGCLVVENHPLDIPRGTAGDAYVQQMIAAVEHNPRLALCPDDGAIAYDTVAEWAERFRALLSYARYAHVKCGKEAFDGTAPDWGLRLSLLRERHKAVPLVVNLEHVGRDCAIRTLWETINSVWR